MTSTIVKLMMLALAAALAAGCASQTLEPGHYGLRFDPHGGGLRHEILKPGRHPLGWCFARDCGRIDDFDVTFSTRHEQLTSLSSEGLAMDLRVSVIFRPIVAELYQLDAEVGQSYYEEVIGPEFRSAARGVLAHHSYAELAQKSEAIEDEIEREVRRRTRGKHVEISSVTLEQISYAPEIAAAVRARIVGEQEAIRKKAALENEALAKKLQLERDSANAQLKIQTTEAEAKLEAELELAKKKNERAIAEEDLALEKAKAAAEIVRAKSEAESIRVLAKAHAEENRAETEAVSPLSVQVAAYEALGKLGGSGTTIFLGDYSHAPQFLFPNALGSFFGLPRTTK
jgi:regulator of protease activity HflC (stomatin/prohibitin superfamily)